jgi:segregation and condensation protein B
MEEAIETTELEPQVIPDQPSDDEITAETDAAADAALDAPLPDDTEGDDAAEPVEEGVAEVAEAEDAAVEVPVDPAAPAEADHEITVESVLEALLFATDAPIPAPKLAQLVGVGDARDIKQHIEELNAKYAQNGHAFRIENIAKGYQMLTLPAYNSWVGKLLKVRDESKLSPAALETLAVVAYKQPVLRADIEVIRGVACGDLLNRLREMNLVKIVGRAEEPGRPMLYGTTQRFLQVFGLGTLADLPTAEALPPPRTET